MIKKRKGAFKSVIYNCNTIYINNLSVPQVFEPFDLASWSNGKRIFNDIIIGLLGVFIMVQISFSARPKSAEWIDQLPSYKDIKYKIINSRPGMILSACVGLASAYPYAREYLEIESDEMYNNLFIIANEMVESYISNTKRIKPTKENWLSFARGEMGAVKGQLLSCPSTNIKKLNINASDVTNFGIDEALYNIGFTEKMYWKYEVNIESIKNDIKKIFLVDKCGIPLKDLIYYEPIHIESKIQSEILGCNIVRKANIDIREGKLIEPDKPINRNYLLKNLNKSEKIAYNICIRTGDTQMIKNLIKKAIARMKKSQEDNFKY